MATKIRLQRHGKKGYAFFHLVVADSRAKRDGKFIEKLGVYNPNTNPATIDINFDQTLHWVGVGAEMSDTARAILSYKGVLYKNHLLKGVKKGAFTEEEAEKRFESWLKEKDSKIEKKKTGISTAAEKAEKDRLSAEKAKNEERAAAQAAAAQAAEAAEAAEAVVENVSDTTDEVTDTTNSENASDTETIEATEEVTETVSEEASNTESSDNSIDSESNTEEEPTA